MNPNLPEGHRDPRTEIVHGKYLYLAAQLIGSKSQDLNYWNTVRVPHAPTNRIAFEELRQVAVFLPLLCVVFAYMKFGFAGALIAFVVALPVMKALHRAMQRAISAKAAEWHRRDAGRYAFTKFMCEEFDLRPEDVTLSLVLKMCDDCKKWVAVATRLRNEAEAAERARRAATAPRGGRSKVPATKFADSAPGVTGGVAAAASVSNVIESDPMPQVNPATGLPMMNNMVDIHGNVFGMDNMEAVFRGMNQVDTNTTFNVGNQSQFGMPDTGFDGVGQF